MTEAHTQGRPGLVRELHFFLAELIELAQMSVQLPFMGLLGWVAEHLPLNRAA